MNDPQKLTDLLVNLSEGNPGALNVLVRLVEDPIFQIDGLFETIQLLIENNIKGPKLWMLFKDRHCEDWVSFAQELMGWVVAREVPAPLLEQLNNPMLTHLNPVVDKIAMRDRAENARRQADEEERARKRREEVEEENSAAALGTSIVESIFDSSDSSSSSDSSDSSSSSDDFSGGGGESGGGGASGSW